MRLQVTLIKVMDLTAAARLLTAVALLTVSGSGRHTNPAALLWLPADAHIEGDVITMKAGPSVDHDGSAAVVFTMKRPDRQKLTAALVEHFELAGGGIGGVIAVRVGYSLAIGLLKRQR